MAGDWIPMRIDLAEDPAVIIIAARTGLDEFAVVGRLHRLWAWANRQLENGCARSVTVDWIDRHLGATGFAAAMVEAGWLTPSDAGVEFPNFERWNSQGAKRRLLAARRMSKSRFAKRDAPSVTKCAPREEKRRVKKKPPKPPAAGGGGGESDDGRRTRPRDELFDAIVEVTGADPTLNGPLVGLVAAELRKADPPYTPADVREFGRRFWELCSWAREKRATLTPGALKNHIGKLRARKSKPSAAPAAKLELYRGYEAEAVQPPAGGSLFRAPQE